MKSQRRPAPSNYPTDNTLRKYGLSRLDFDMLLEAQGGVCAICKRRPNGRWNIDHFHIKGWSRMRPERRKRYVRGVTCWICNKYYLGRGITIERAQNVVRYLQDFQDRLSK